MRPGSKNCTGKRPISELFKMRRMLNMIDAACSRAGNLYLLARRR